MIGRKSQYVSLSGTAAAKTTWSAGSRKSDFGMISPKMRMIVEAINRLEHEHEALDGRLRPEQAEQRRPQQRVEVERHQRRVEHERDVVADERRREEARGLADELADDVPDEALAVGAHLGPEPVGRDERDLGAREERAQHDHQHDESEGHC